MKYFIILLIASFVFFGCDANNAGDDSGIGSGDGSSQDGGDNDISDGHHCTEDDISLGITTYMGEPYITITDQAGLKAIRNDQATLEAHHILCNNISLNSSFTRITGGFTGTLDGNGKTISNLIIQDQSSQANYVGLFSKIGTDGEVRDLTLSLAGGAGDSDILGITYVGALAGENKGTITNVGVNGGYVKGYGGNVGGLVGNNDGGTITASYATSTIESGSNKFGGLVGRNSGTITASYATGTVTGTRIGAGANYSVGGLVGDNDGGTITASHATGTVTGNSMSGGLVGNNDGGTVEKSYATGNVTGTGGYIGGLVGNNFGSNAEITASYATGTVAVTGGSYIGGLVGHNTGTITASYFDAATTEQSLFIGNESVADRAYYTDTTSANREVYTETGGNGTLIVQTDFDSTYWDFDTIWAWQGAGQWPLLQFQ